MNISHEHKIIWWAPERCATKATAHILTHFGFKFYYNDDEEEKNPLGDIYQSHNIDIPEKYKDYRIICNIRNPYSRVLGLYTAFTNVGRSLVYSKDRHTFFMERYEQFLRELFLFKTIKKRFGFDEKEEKVFLKDYISKYNFEERIPDIFIRMENMEEDLGKLPFIRESELWKSGYIHDYILKNPHINNKPYKFNTIYTTESANRVFNYYKKHFFLCGYDPFSFTNKDLTNDEKMNFLHVVL